MEMLLVLLVLGMVIYFAGKGYVYRGTYVVPVLTDHGVKAVNVISDERQESIIKSSLRQVRRITTLFWETDANGACEILEREWKIAEQNDNPIHKLACAAIERSLLLGDTRGWVRKPEGWNQEIWEPIVRLVLREGLYEAQLRQLG